MANKKKTAAQAPVAVSAASAGTTTTATPTATAASSSSRSNAVLLSVLVAVAAVGYGVFRSTTDVDLAALTAATNGSSYGYGYDAVLQPFSHYFGSLLADSDSDSDIDIWNTTSFGEQWNKLTSSIRAESSKASLKSAANVGHRMVLEAKEAGEPPLKAKHPVFMVPGFVTSGLELWEGHDCASSYFRRKIWGSLETFKSFAKDTDCWKAHLSLNPQTGKDPEGIRLRPSQGFEAADFWTSAFWVWDRVIRNLATVGYDGSNMDMVSYDWRLSYPALEQRDGHFSKLKSKIESFVKYTGEKAVIVGHSMGAPCVFWFLVWVGRPAAEGGGGGGTDWVERHVHAYVDLAGPMLGLPKAASALLSGEMKDTNLLSSVGGLIESLFGRQKRHELFSSWGALWGMAPKGGDDVWGISADVDCGEGRVLSADECVNASTTNLADTPFLKFTDMDPPSYEENPTVAKYAAKHLWTFEDVMGYLSDWKAGHHGPESLKGVGGWNDPTVHPLPNAPSLNVYCMYGVGLPTERMFYYHRQGLLEGDVPFLMNDTVKDDPSQSINFGVRTANGDGSVPLLSLGYACAEAWKTSEGSNPLNPGNSRVVTREYQHRGSFQVDDPMRQGPESSEHCDILGNHEVMEDLIRIATGNGETVQPRIVSNIEQIAQQVRDKKKKREEKSP